MALINCPECNKEISDKAPTCPSCGITRPGKRGLGLGTLVIKRIPKYVMSLVSWRILIDDNEVGQVQNGSTFSIELSAGEHSLEVRAAGARDAKKTITISDTETLNIETCVDGLFLQKIILSII